MWRALYDTQLSNTLHNSGERKVHGSSGELAAWAWAASPRLSSWAEDQARPMREARSRSLLLLERRPTGTTTCSLLTNWGSAGAALLLVWLLEGSQSHPVSPVSAFLSNTQPLTKAMDRSPKPTPRPRIGHGLSETLLAREDSPISHPA